MRKALSILCISCGLGIVGGPLLTLAGPSQSQVENLADAAGSAAADFEACGEGELAGRIKRTFKSIAVSCTEDSDGEDSALNAYDLGYAKRLNEVSSSGGVCGGNNQSRYRTIRDALSRALDSC